MLIQKQAKVRVLGAAMIFALMFVCSVATFAQSTASPSSIQFPGTTVGATSAPISVTITNSSSSSTVYSSVYMSASQFSYNGPAMPVTLAAGQSFTASVTFTPAALQAYSGTMTFFRRTGAPLVSVNLSGSGVAAPSEALVASPGALSFSAQVGAAAPAAQSLTIGENPAGAVAFSVSADQSWISLSAGSGTTSGAISVGANISGLAAGSYSGHVNVSAAGVTNSPMSIPVTLVVAAAAPPTPSPYILQMSASSMSFSGAAGTVPACQSLVVFDSTPGKTPDLPISVSVDSAWLTISQNGGPASSQLAGWTAMQVQVCAKTAGLAAGTYNGHIIEAETGPNAAGLTVNNSPFSIPVSLVVTAAPPTSALTAAPSSLSFSGQVGAAAPATQSLTIGENPAGAVAFTASADQAWITLSATSGTTSSAIQVGANISGLAAGSYSGHVNVSASGVTNSPMSIPVTLVVAAAQTHALTAAPSAISFSAQAGAAAPAAQSLTIGENPAGAVAFTASADQAWITLSATSGTTTGAISVGANISGMAAGSYSGHVIVSAAGMTNAPMSIPVTMVVAAAQTYALTASPSALSFSATSGAALPAAQTLTIGDSPASALPFSVSADQTWITLSAASGTTSGSVQVTANTTGMAAGTYSGHVIISAAGVTNSPMSIPVSVVVAAGTPSPYILQMTPSSLAFTGAVGSSPACQSLVVFDSTPGKTPDLPISVSVDSAWMTISQNGGAASSQLAGWTAMQVQVCVKTAGLAAGTFTGHIIETETAPNAAGLTVNNSPFSIPVTLVVTAAQPTASLTAAPSSLAFTAVAGGAAPATQGLTIGENPAGAVAFTVTADQAWMTLSAASGTTSSTIQVGANISGLAAGNYTGHVITTASGVTNSPMSVTVTLAVTAAQTNLLSVSPTSLAFGNINVGNNNTKSVTVTNSGTGNVSISGITTTGAGMSANGIATPMTLTAGQSTVLSVVFAPTAVGAVNGTVSVASNASNTPGVITVTGTGVQPQLSASPSTLNFGSVAVGANGTQTITLSNTGGAAVSISQAVISGTGYTMSGLTIPTSLAAGTSVSFSVQFTPQAAGSVSGSVTVTSNTPNSPTMIALNGTGTAPIQHSVSLSWVASTSSTVVGYNVYRSTVSGGPYTLLNSTPNAGLNYTDMAVTAGQTYYYVVTAVDASGMESAQSNQASAVIPTP
jgi:large repetitive protein